MPLFWRAKGCGEAVRRNATKRQRSSGLVVAFGPSPSLSLLAQADALGSRCRVVGYDHWEMVRQLLGKPSDKEASRKVASRKVVINGEEITAEQALIRSMYLNGIRGKVTTRNSAPSSRGSFHGAKGLAVPGMPVGSPRMEGGGSLPETYDVVLFGNGKPKIFATLPWTRRNLKN